MALNFNRFDAFMQHIESGLNDPSLLGHKTFDFGIINSHRSWLGEQVRFDKCGTVGCFLGELPVLFPDKWIFRGSLVFLYYQTSGSCQVDVERFFGFKDGEFDALFEPYEYVADNIAAVTVHTRLKLEQLAKGCSYEEALGNLRKFYKWKKKYA